MHMALLSLSDLPAFYSRLSSESIRKRFLFVIDRDGLPLSQISDQSLLPNSLLTAYVSHPLQQFPYDQSVLEMIDQRIRGFLYQSDWLMVNVVHKQMQAYGKWKADQPKEQKDENEIEPVQHAANGMKQEHKMNVEHPTAATADGKSSVSSSPFAGAPVPPDEFEVNELPPAVSSRISLSDYQVWLSMSAFDLEDREAKDRMFVNWLSSIRNEKWALPMKVVFDVLTKIQAGNRGTDDEDDTHDEQKSKDERPFRDNTEKEIQRTDRRDETEKDKKTLNPKETECANTLELLPSGYAESSLDCAMARAVLISRRDRISQNKIATGCSIAYAKWSRLLATQSGSSGVHERSLEPHHSARLRKWLYLHDCELILRFAPFVRFLVDTALRETRERDLRRAQVNPGVFPQLEKVDYIKLISLANDAAHTKKDANGTAANKENPQSTDGISEEKRMDTDNEETSNSKDDTTAAPASASSSSAGGAASTASSSYPRPNGFVPWNSQTSTYQSSPLQFALRGRIISDNVPFHVLLKWLDGSLALHLRHLVDSQVIRFLECYHNDEKRRKRNERQRSNKMEKRKDLERSLLIKRRRDEERRKARKALKKADQQADAEAAAAPAVVTENEERTAEEDIEPADGDENDNDDGEEDGDAADDRQPEGDNEEEDGEDGGMEVVDEAEE